MTQQINMFGVRNKKWHISIFQRQALFSGQFPISWTKSKCCTFPYSLFSALSLQWCHCQKGRCQRKHQQINPLVLQNSSSPLQPQARKGTHKLNPSKENERFKSLPFILWWFSSWFRRRDQKNIWQNIGSSGLYINKCLILRAKWNMQSLPKNHKNPEVWDFWTAGRGSHIGWRKRVFINLPK